jgi:hypothetical protein
MVNGSVKLLLVLALDIHGLVYLHPLLLLLHHRLPLALHFQTDGFQHRLHVFLHVLLAAHLLELLVDFLAVLGHLRALLPASGYAYMISSSLAASMMVCW